MADPFHDSPAWLALRYKVLKRSNGCCELCGSPGGKDNPLQCDHIKPRSQHPELALIESNIQVLCRHCNVGKSNKDATAWKWKVSPHLVKTLSRKTDILATADPLTKAKLEQLGWLKQNDVSAATRKEAEKQYKALWEALERAYDDGEAE